MILHALTRWAYGMGIALVTVGLIKSDVWSLVCGALTMLGNSLHAEVLRGQS